MRHFTVTEKVVVCISEPDAPVTVTAEVTAAREAVVANVAPPHPFNRHRPATLTTSSNSICRPRRFFQLMKHSATASTDPGNSGLGAWCNAALVVDVITVSAVEAAAPDGATVCGEKMHDTPAGNPAQFSDTGALNPLIGVTETMTVAVCPEFIVSEVGEAETEKSAAGTLVVYAALATVLVVKALAVAIAASVSVDDTVIGPVYTAEPVVGVLPSVVK
jgi:hypothetical protein